MTILNLISLVGLLVLAGLAWAIGGFRRPVAWRTITGAGIVMLVMGIPVFILPQTRVLLLIVNDLVVALLGASRVGAEFLLGPLTLNPGETTIAGEPSVGFVLAAQVLPAVIFFASLMAVGYHVGIIQPIIQLFGRLFRKTLQLSGAESLAGSSNIFVGIESATTVRPYLETMTRSELLTLLTCAMSTVASTTLALYVFFLQEPFPQIAGHLISASVLSIPAAALVSKLMIPENGQPRTMGSLPPPVESQLHSNAMAALSAGSWDGLRLAAGIATLLIAILGLVGLIDLMLSKVMAPLDVWVGTTLTLQQILGWVFTPLAWLLGIESGDILQAGQLLGQRMLLTEVVAYQQLGEMATAETLSPRTILVLSYALCGFAHVASVGIFVGGITALVPCRRDDLSSLAFPALAGSTLATLMTGALAGLFYHGQHGILGF